MAWYDFLKKLFSGGSNELTLEDVPRNYNCHSFKRMDLTNLPPEEFSNKTIKKSCFYQDEPNTMVFPAGVVNCTLEDCNLDNVELTPEFIVVRGTHNQVMIQNDGEYWIVDGNLKPVSPQKPDRYDRYGLSKDPKNLPAEQLEENIIVTAEKEKVKQDRKNRIIAIASDPQALDNLVNEGGEL